MFRNAAVPPMILIGLLSFLARPLPAQERDCVACHEESSPGLVADWRASKHSEMGVTCVTCHRGAHTNAETPDETGMPTPATCAQCHEERVEQYSRGKHAQAWAAMKAMPTLHWQPMAVTEGMKGCGGCHRLGFKSGEEIQELKEDGQAYGVASCDVCHTRHSFSVVEARQPQACQTCHMGGDHDQWAMYSSSKHGVRYLLNQNGALSGDAPAPTCQTCHMPRGDHEVRTAWGSLGLRADDLKGYPGEDEDWWWDRVTIMQALGILGPDGEPTGRLDAIRSADMIRMSADGFDAQRAATLEGCTHCHAQSFASGEVEKGDRMLRRADGVMAEAVRTVVDLYRDGLLETPDYYSFPFPDLLTFHDAPTAIEQRLFTMFFTHRSAVFKGAFHSNPSALWGGWHEMNKTLTEIKELAEEIRGEGGA